ncbi:2OG-Fe(II) oxygenase [Curvibacter sp. RS43]|uniref:2OG-Fe(II) oxygenase n=1 Tax=Curvibacter microcysteis TaxID=3026419 RepID=A0ABT5MKA2_9BURK|nr:MULTISPECIES: 2OG-Fe(II) oxygenase [unclassified Curvibacter]MDD0810683.1 2OG-Fe(II) oxygenase [Curvibacter sp. RS43]MDD0815581.1 2OG-Fe(II) oxygenase [Curvibacter sp. HBC28]
MTNAANPSSNSQAITPALTRWILEQSEAGHDPASVLQAMQAAGWTEAVALQALEQTLKQQLDVAQARAATPRLPPSQPLPAPLLQGSPLYVDAGDRQVAVLMHLQNPSVVLFGDFLSAEECEGLIAAAEPRLARSLTVMTQTGGEEVSVDRTSDGMFFSRGESALIQRIEERIARLLNWPLLHGEGLQVLHYRPGAEYKPHYDYFDPHEPGTPTILKRGGQRVATLVMYLNEPAQGGGTTFPDLQLEVTPKRGNAVFFSYAQAHPSSRTLHGGAPVLAGEKWVATKWLREGEFH